ncbi:DUF6392 family protein [Pseudomonas japonica]|uniref:DUF6392 family protein n=1 Tax=Pseudomonas japonica TaxID=256466 RepID=UPI0005A9233A|nr:DUF6392 family protein [Pseudomonas japonica]
MDANTIISLVKGLGRTHEELVMARLIQDTALTPLFKEGDNEDLIHKPVPGISLWFWAETSRLERIVITLVPRDKGIPAYTGELPLPFTRKMNQAGVHAALGVPDRSQGPAKLPLPAGMTGGWDAYRLDRALHHNAEVAIQFMADKSASGLAFRLIDKGHD